MKIYQRILSATALFLLALAVLPAPLFAQTSEGLNITTSPYLINLVTNPGNTVSADIKIHNNANASQKLVVGLMKFTASGEQGKPQLAEKQSGDDYFDWLSFSENKFTLAPNEWKTIKATIKVPSSAAFGYYYAVTFTQEGKNTPNGQPSAALSGSSAVLILVDVKSANEKRELSLLDFSADKAFYEFLPATFSVRVKNSGNIHVVPHGTIFIDSGKTHDLGLVDVNKQRGNVLPGSNRLLTVQWDDAIPVYVTKMDHGNVVSDAKGNPVKELKWDFNNLSKIRFGKYTAHLLLVYDNGTRDIPLEGTVSFWVVPVRLILFGIAIPVVPALLVYFFMKWHFKRAARKQ